MISLCLILPADDRSNGNDIAIALGQDVPPGNTYTVPLSPNGAGPATHFACHTWASPGFVLMVEIAKGKEAPPNTAQSIIETAMRISSDYPATISNLLVSAKDTDDPQSHCYEFFASLGLSIAKQT